MSTQAGAGSRPHFFWRRIPLEGRATAVGILTVVCLLGASCTDLRETADPETTASPQTSLPDLQGANPEDAADPQESAQPQSRSPLLGSFPDLQAANDQPKFALVGKRSSGLADNRIGMSLSGGGPDLPHLGDRVDDITFLGLKRVHSYLNEIEPPIDWEEPEYEIPPEFDRFVDALADSGVQFDYLLHYWDKDGRARGETLSTPRFKDPSQVEEFIDYTRFIVRHLKGRISNYTLWSEPDNCGQEGGIKCVEPGDYIELARRVIPVIREEDPAATVGFAPVVLFFERDFLPTVLSSDVAPMFDVIQWHGQYGVTPDDPFYREHGYYEEYPLIVEDIKRVAEANGFRGEYWSTEMGWCSPEIEPPCENPDHPWGSVATNRIAAKYYARAIVSHLGMDVAAGVSPEEPVWIDATIRHLATVMAGATPIDLEVDVSGLADGGTADPVRSYAFGLSDGAKLVAVWTDGPAVHDTAGFPATLTFPGLSESSAVGIDVVYGFEQTLITDTDGGDLVIRDLLVRDYPTILRLSPG